MKTTKEMPTEGQFVAVWEQDEKIISGELRYERGFLHIWDKMWTIWRKVQSEFPPQEFSNIHYITLDSLRGEQTDE